MKKTASPGATEHAPSEAGRNGMGHYLKFRFAGVRGHRICLMRAISLYSREQRPAFLSLQDLLWLAKRRGTTVVQQCPQLIPMASTEIYSGGRNNLIFYHAWYHLEKETAVSKHGINIFSIVSWSHNALKLMRTLTEDRMNFLTQCAKVLSCCWHFCALHLRQD